MMLAFAAGLWRESHWASKLSFFALAAAWLWASWMLLACMEPLWDEGNQLAQAWRLAQGDRLYQEIWEFAGPLPLAVMAGIYWLWGPSLDLARVLACGLLGVSSLCVALLGRRLGAPWPLACGLAMLLPLGVQPAYRAFYHHWFSWALVLWAWLWVAHPRPAQLPWWSWLVAGLALGLASLSTLTVGVLGALALPFAACFLAPSDRPWRALLGGASLVLLGFFLPWLLALMAFSTQGGAGAFVHQNLVWPLAHYKQAGGINDVWPLSDLGTSLPFDASRPLRWLGSSLARLGVASLHAWGCLLALWLGVMAIARRLRGQGMPWPWALMMTGSVLAAVVAWRGRADLTHMAMSAMPALVLLAGALGQAWRVGLAARPSRPEAAWLGAFPSALAALLLLLCGFSELRQAMSQAALDQLGLGLDARFRRSEWASLVAQHFPQGGLAVAFPQQGWLFLFTPMKPGTRFGYLAQRGFRYNGPAEYAAFAADWAAHPPDLVVLSGGVSPASAVADWGPKGPSLANYRLLGRPGGLGGGYFLVRQEQGASGD